MTQQIHPTAVIDPQAALGHAVEIGPYCVVGPHVRLGNNVRLLSHVAITGHTTLEEGCTVYPFASIGFPPPDLKYRGELSTVHVGKNTVIREYVTINPGTAVDKMTTRVGDNCLLMVSVHIAHDCIVGNNVIMANNATLGGHVEVGDYVVIGGLSGIHQYVRIGKHAIIGGMSAVDGDVIPYGAVKGERAFLNGLNLVGLKRRGFSRQEIDLLRKAYRMVFSPEGTFAERLEDATTLFPDNDFIKELVSFVKQDSKAGLCLPMGREG